MSFLARLSDSSDDEHNNSSLFSHSARNLTSIVAEQARKRSETSEVSRAAPKRRNELERPAKRKSKDIDGDDEEKDDQGGIEASISPATRNTAVESSEPPRFPVMELKVDATEQARSYKSDDRTNARSTIEPPPQEDRCYVQLTSEAPVHLNDPPASKGIFKSAQINKEDDPQADDSDDEFAEIAKQARLLARQKKLGQGVNGDIAKTTQTSRESEPKVEIFLSSELPNTTPLRVFLRLSQHLGLVRSAWCQRQGFPPGVERQIYLTYRQRKIYDVSTCRSLGLDVDSYGRLVLRGAEGKIGIEKVYLEAVTDAYLAEMRFRQEAALRTAEAAIEHDQLATIAQPQDRAEQLVRIILKARNAPDYKLRVRPTTTIAKIASAYRRQHNLDDATAISLLFDGDELEADQLLQDTEIADLDQIEVHFR